MSGVFRNIDPPPLTARRVCTPPPFGAGGGHTRLVERGWGSIVRKTPDTALYSLCVYFVHGGIHVILKNVNFSSSYFIIYIIVGLRTALQV